LVEADAAGVGAGACTEVPPIWPPPLPPWLVELLAAPAAAAKTTVNAAPAQSVLFMGFLLGISKYSPGQGECQYPELASSLRRLPDFESVSYPRG
jgi:hypothetical protein